MRVQSFKLVESGLMLNLDSAFAAFMSERSLPDLLAEMCNTRDLSRVDPHRLRAAARNLSGFKVRDGRGRGASGWPQWYRSRPACDGTRANLPSARASLTCCQT